MITTIIFDLAEVYLKGYEGVQHHLKDLLNLPPEDIWHKIGGPEFKSLMEGRIDEDEFWAIILKRNNWNIDIKHFKKAIRKNFQEIEGTREIIEQLKRNGYKLGLLSDHSREWAGYCNEKFDYHRLFHSTQYSFEVECCKRDPKAFKSILKKLGEKAENCLFIDDYERNLEVAKSVGLNTLQFIHPEKLKEDLKRFSIKL